MRASLTFYSLLFLVSLHKLFGFRHFSWQNWGLRPTLICHQKQNSLSSARFKLDPGSTESHLKISMTLIARSSDVYDTLELFGLKGNSPYSENRLTFSDSELGDKESERIVAPLAKLSISDHSLIAEASPASLDLMPFKNDPAPVHAQHLCDVADHGLDRLANNATDSHDYENFSKAAVEAASSSCQSGAGEAGELCSRDPPRPTERAVEDKVCAMVRQACGVRSDFRFPEGGVALVSHKRREAMTALQSPYTSTIAGVPVDVRYACKAQLLKSVRLKRVDRIRIPLLCNAASRGSGKSTLQGFNFQWFNEEKRGIAVEVTWNDDQRDLWKGEGEVLSNRDLDEGTAVRILNRAIRHLGGSSQTLRDELIAQVKLMERPIVSALRITRLLLGAPSDTPILVGIDELSKAALSPKTTSTPPSAAAGLAPPYTPEKMLKRLTTHLDSDPTLFLSVTAYGAVTLVDFNTKSNRELLLQSLPPLWHTGGFDPQSAHLLPSILQPLFDEDMRNSLPLSDATLDLCGKVSQWIMKAGGHPRRVQTLLEALSQFTFSADKLKTLKYGSTTVRTRVGKDFVSAASQWLAGRDSMGTSMEEHIGMEVTAAVDLPLSFEGLAGRSATDKEVADAVESLAVDTARAFNIAADRKNNENAATLEGSGLGYCQVVTSEADPQLVNAFVPMAVLDACKDYVFPWQPCGQALFQLRKAVQHYQTFTGEDDGSVADEESGRGKAEGGVGGMTNTATDKGAKKGKLFEKVIAYALLLYARANRSFSPSALCDPQYCGKDLEGRVMGGKSVQYIEVPSFPLSTKPGRAKVTNKHMQSLIDRVDEGSNGAVIVPTAKYNLVGDIYGLFRLVEGGWLLVTLQCKDWFVNPVRGDTFMVEHWRQWRSTCFPRDTFSVHDSKGGKTTVKVVHLLYSANDNKFGDRQTRPLECEKAEGAGTIVTMRRWLPTAAYACESARNLNKLFAVTQAVSQQTAADEED